MEPSLGRPRRGSPLPALLITLALAVPLVVMIRMVARGPRSIMFLGALFPLLFLAVSAFMLGQRHARIRRAQASAPQTPAASPPPAPTSDGPIPPGR